MTVDTYRGSEIYEFFEVGDQTVRQSRLLLRFLVWIESTGLTRAFFRLSWQSSGCRITLVGASPGVDAAVG